MSSMLMVNETKFADDVRSEMTDSSLMAKYGLSSEELEEVFKTLLETEVLSRADFEAWTIFGNQTVPLDIRLFRRRMSEDGLEVFRKDSLETSGTIINISQSGVGIRGMRAVPDEIVTLVVPNLEFRELGTIVLETRCRWMRNEGEERNSVGGFYIITVAEGKWSRLLELVEQHEETAE